MGGLLGLWMGIVSNPRKQCFINKSMCRLAHPGKKKLGFFYRDDDTVACISLTDEDSYLNVVGQGLLVLEVLVVLKLCLGQL
jgi:hypothetical protein